MVKKIDFHQFMIGSRLGDGSFVKKSESHNVYVVFKHCEEQYEYLNWKYNIMHSFGLIRQDGNGIRKVNIKEGSCYNNFQNQFMFSTVSNPIFNRYKNISDEDIAKDFGEQAFAIWVLDDGNINNKTTRISCGSLSEKLCMKLVETIKNVIGIDVYYYRHPKKKTKNYIRIPARHYGRVRDIILKYIPENIDIVKDKFDITYKHNLEIKIKYFTEQPKLCYIENKSDWIDLRAAETVELKAGEFKLIPLGIGMILPDGYEAHVVPRSSTFKRFGVIQTNHMGVIDQSYCGDNDQWKFPAYALRDTVIKKNDRICQFRIEKKQPEFDLVEVDHLNDTDRGGFGSTGTR